jgi:hypothetical protein
MKTLLHLLTALTFDLSLYPIAEGVEEYRVKRKILSNIKQDGGRAAFALMDECGPLRPKNNSNNA